MHTHMHTHIHIHTYIYTHTYTYTHTFIHTHIHVHTYVYIDTHGNLVHIRAYFLRTRERYTALILFNAHLSTWFLYHHEDGGNGVVNYLPRLGEQCCRNLWKGRRGYATETGILVLRGSLGLLWRVGYSRGGH